ncbi:MAG: fibronectin type III domain-containing protein [Planctomycetes bacterium]|nr:fibronectin type III domain-containing protein [Planctomycetota bacterium]
MRVALPLLAVSALASVFGTTGCGPVAIGAGLAANSGGGGGGDSGVPLRPASITATATGPTSIQLVWSDSSPNENGFRIYRVRGEILEVVAELAAGEVTYGDADLQPATVYTYRVQSFNDVGSSPFSEDASATTAPEPAPPAPTALVARSAGATALDLNWVNGTDGTGVIRIERADAAAFALVGTVPGDATSYRDAGLTPATTYDYRVRAVRQGQPSPYSSVASATTEPAPAPKLEAATVMVENPTAGHVLVLFLSEDVTLVPNATLDDEDLTIADGTLGMITTPPTLISPRLIAVTLGGQSMLTASVSTITFSNTNDAVRGVNGVMAGPGPLREVVRGDGDLPAVDSLSLNQIDVALNGSGPAGGMLQVPTTGFAIDVGASDPSSAIVAAATTISASLPVVSVGQVVPPGWSFTSQLIATTTASGTSYTVPPGMTFAEGPVTITVVVRDETGMPSAPRTFGFLCRVATEEIRPLETTVNPAQLWYLDLSRDVESYYPEGGGHPMLRVSPEANGDPDIEDLWRVLGLLGNNANANDLARQHLIQGLLQQLDQLFLGVNVTFRTSAPGAFPVGMPSLPYSEIGFSQICIGSSARSSTNTTIGNAQFDPNNQRQENNCLEDHLGDRLGVFVYAIVRDEIRSQGGNSEAFHEIFDPLTPAPYAAGQPIGDDPGDGDRLAGLLLDARKDAIDLAIATMARLMAVLTARQCGRSMGLVKDLPMPAGLYGGNPNFGTTSQYIDNNPQFPGTAINIMCPPGRLNFRRILDPGTGFNSLNLAYLRERVLVDL